MPVSGLLIDVLGWPSVFYTFGMLGLLWSIAWWKFASSAPPSAADGGLLTMKSRTIPWKVLFTNRAVIAVMLAHTAHNFLFFMLLTWIPSYLHHMLGLSVHDAADATLIPYLACFVGSVASGVLSDHLINVRNVSVRKVRVGMQFLAEVLPAFFLSLVGYTSSVPVAVALLTASVGFSGFGGGGYACNYLDIAPSRTALIIGIGNTCATLPGILAPAVVGAIVKPPHDDLAHWRLAFFTSAAIAVVGFILFAYMAKAERVPEIDGGDDEPEAGANTDAGSDEDVDEDENESEEEIHEEDEQKGTNAG